MAQLGFVQLIFPKIDKMCFWLMFNNVYSNIEHNDFPQSPSGGVAGFFETEVCIGGLLESLLVSQ